MANDPSLLETLCGCTSTNRGEALLICLMFAARYSLSWVAIVDLLKLVNTLFGKPDMLPQSKYLLLKSVPIDVECLKCHFYCISCKSYVGERPTAKAGNMRTDMRCTVCNATVKESDTSFFVSLGFESQVKELLRNPRIVQCLQYRFRRTKLKDDSFEDVYDGRMYKKLCEPGAPLHYKWNLSYTLNTDGCQAANSSKVTIWPIYATINELPPKMRSKYMLLVGLWADKSEPNMNVFLPPFIDEANSLSTNGVQWRLSNDTIVKSCIIPSACSVDSIARADMLNIKRMNSVHGCTFCEHETERVDNYRRYTISETVYADRTDACIRRDMLSAHNLQGADDVNGVKGPSALMNLKYFDLGNGMVPDYMHSALLGVARQHTELLMASPGKKYYVGDPTNIGIINRRLLSMTPPTCITRTPREIGERKMWKASEWRSWLIWYSLTCLSGLIPKSYIIHLSMFVTAMNILLQDSITPNMIETAEILLIKYVLKYQKYFGKGAMTYNVHLLLHLAKSVRNWGPLWATNCFAFENENRSLLQLKKSPASIMLQISQKFLFQKSLLHFSDTFVVNNVNVKNFCEHLHGHKLKFFSNEDDCLLIGSGKVYILSQEEANCLQYGVLDCQTYHKMIINGKRYCSETYTRCTKTKDTVVHMVNGKIGIISNICKVTSEREEKKVIIFVKVIETDNRPYISTNDMKVTHIRRCRLDVIELNACTPKCIVGPCILMEVDNTNYVSKVPRGCLGD